MSFENKEDVDINKLNQLKLKVLFEEKRNLRTRKKTKNEMIEYIRRAIIDIVNEWGDNMLIKSLKLKNFRQFKGDININFSYDSQKNVTIILGDNTYGKTTL